MELIEKISALVPPRRINLIRYHGVLAPAAKNRDKIVPAPKPADNEQNTDNESPASYKYRLSFAALLVRVFQIQIETCPHCGGRMRIVAALTDPSSISRYLEVVGLSAEITKLSRRELRLSRNSTSNTEKLDSEKRLAQSQRTRAFFRLENALQR